MVNSRLNKNGRVAAARHAGPGNRTRASRPNAHAAIGRVSSPRTLISLKAMLYGMTYDRTAMATIGPGK